MNGGDERIRTADPLVANEVLSQLSYIPKKTLGSARTCHLTAASHCQSDLYATKQRFENHTSNRRRASYQGAGEGQGNGGERGIRTLEAGLAPTRFPIVLLRPTRTSLHI